MIKLEAKLEQALKDYAASNETFDTEIASIKQQIADSEVTYSIGDRLGFNDGSKGKRILAAVGGKVAIIDLSDGFCVGKAVEVTSLYKITKLELASMNDCNCYEKYWDHVKQCKC
jgi:hypothetical protein